MLSKKPFGFVFFLVFFIFLFLDLFLFYQTTRLLVPYPILLQFRPDLSISTYTITLFTLMSKMALSLLLGYLLPICQPIFLRSLSLHPFLYVIMTYWVFLFLLNNFSFLFLFYILPLRPDGGVLGCQVVLFSHHVFVAPYMYICRSFLFFSSVVVTILTLRQYVLLFLSFLLHM